MKTRVNLTIEDSLLKSTKAYAEKRGISVSELVEDYLKVITKPVKTRTIFDIVDEFGESNIDPKADLIALYYLDKKNGK